MVFKKTNSFLFLNATQFLGALNDNIFKLLVAYFLISLKGAEDSSSILAITGAIFVLPYLVFSSAAGILADRISKQKILVGSKFLEAIIMLVTIFAFYLKWDIGAYVLLFFLAFQSALFGPSKYSIIPEIVSKDQIVKANGIITSLTYLAIILGIFLASFLTDITHKNFIVVQVICLSLALLGLLTSFGIEMTKAQKSEQKIRPFFFYEIYKTLRSCKEKENLLPVIFGSSSFLFIGAFIQLNMIPFAMQSLKTSDLGGGYLFSLTAIGMIGGSLFAGKLLKDKIQPGLSCLSGFMISLICFLLFLFSKSLIIVILLMLSLGFFGGLFLIPLDSFIQLSAPPERRGEIIAAGNFLSYAGMLLSSVFLLLFSNSFHLTAREGFALFGLIILVFSLAISSSLSSLFLSFLTQKIFSKFYPYKLSVLPDSKTLIILKKRSWKDSFMLFSLLPKLKILSIRKSLLGFPFFNGWNSSFGVISEFLHPKDQELALLKLAQQKKRENEHCCLFIDSAMNRSEWKNLMKTFPDFPFQDIIFTHIEKEKKPSRYLGFSFIQKTYTFYFTDEPL